MWSKLRKMFLSDAAISLCSFLAPSLLCSLFVILPQIISKNLYQEQPGMIWWILLSNFVVINIILKAILQERAYQVGLRATFLGTVFSTGVCINVMFPLSYKIFGRYMCVMAFFHYSEYLTIALTNPKTLSIDSFILNHSNEYTIAAISSWIEFFIEHYFFPGLKEYWIISCFGLILCIGGEMLRKLAMFTARSNFNHIVQSVHQEGHKLVTSGVYSMFRHPSYVGWFYWAIGTQLILVNPVCILAYTLASWKFFNERIFVEEITLLNFFGEDYMEYQKQVGTGLPFIKGYTV